MKKSCLLLVNPWIYDFKAYDYWMKPLGLLYIASILEHNGYQIIYIDCLDRHHPAIPVEKRAESTLYGCGSFYYEEIKKPLIYKDIPRKYKRYGIPLDAFNRIIRSIPPPDAILVTSGMTFWYPGAFKAIELLKEQFPKVPLLLGGIYCRLCPEHAEENSGADVIFPSSDMVELIRILAQITGNTKYPEFCDFLYSPPPLFRLIYEPSYLPILTSLGCPFKCSYCATGKLFPRLLQRNPVQIFKELLSMLQEIPVNDIAFYDDALLVNFESHLKILLDLVIEKKLDVRLHSSNALHAMFITPLVARMLKKANFHTIRLGLEFSKESLQRETGGKVTNSIMEEAIKNLHNAGFPQEQIGVFVMTGTPGLQYDDIKEAILAVNKWKAISKLVEYSPIPHTEMWSEFIEIDPKRTNDPLYHNNTYHTYSSTILPFTDFQKLKKLSQELNHTLRKK